MQAFGYVCAFIFTLIISVIADGYALSILWGWFLVPLGLQAISITTAIGISMIFTFLTHHSSKNDDSKDFRELMVKMVGACLLKPMMAILFGWLVYSFR